MNPPVEVSPSSWPFGYRLLFERNPMPMWAYGVATLQILAVNNAAVAQYGYSRSEFLDLMLLDLHPAGDAPQLHEELALPVDEQGQPRRWRHRHRDGRVLEAETISEAFDHNGVAARMVLVTELNVAGHDEIRQPELTDHLTRSLESLPIGFVSLDSQWRFAYVNRRAEEMLGRNRQQMLGFNMLDLYPEHADSIFQKHYERAANEGKAVSFEAYVAHLNVRWEVDAYPSAQGLAVYFRDITEEHQTRQWKLNEHQALAAVLDATTEGIVGVDNDGTIRLFNRGAERIFGRTGQSVLGKQLEMLLPERYRAAHAVQQHEFPAAGLPSRMMGLGLVKGLRADGQELDLEGTLLQTPMNGQRIKLATFRDVTLRVKAAAEKEQSRRQLSDLTKRLMLQEKALVKRLAQALHDQLGQTVAAIRIVHETILAKQPRTEAPDLERLDLQMGSLINQAMRQIRQVLLELRPPLLEENGLAAALENELRNRALAQPEVDVIIYVSPEISPMRWPAEVEYAGFMVAREAVENALRHAGASRLTVRLTGAALALNLTIEDDGRGIGEDVQPQPGHLGILGMRERAQSCGASVTICDVSDSGSGSGTLVSFSWSPEP